MLPTLPKPPRPAVGRDRVRVIVRVRQPIPEDLRLSATDESCVTVPAGEEQQPPAWFDAKAVEIPYTPSVKLRRFSHDVKEFRFDAVLPATASQVDTYNVAARERVMDVLAGFNASIILYGQTSSGKSFSSFGPPTSPLISGNISSCGRSFDNLLTPTAGIIPRAVGDIFAELRSSTAPYQASVCYVQIYKDQVFDLFLNFDGANTASTPVQPLVPLQIREDRNGIFVNNLTHIPVYQDTDVFRALVYAANRRAVAATQMNRYSSRSHVVLMLTIERRHADGSVRHGILTIADLAGSERVSKTLSDGERLLEAKKINQSLSALGNCIVALTLGKPYIPFRDSPLTRLLTESLSGNSRTVVVATIGPSVANYDESNSTLLFATRCMAVRTTPSMNTLDEFRLRGSQRGAPRDGPAYDSSKAMTILGEAAIMRDDDQEETACMVCQCPRCGVNLTVLPSSLIEKYDGDAALEKGSAPSLLAPAGASQEGSLQDDESSAYSELSVNRVPTGLREYVSGSEDAEQRPGAPPQNRYRAIIASLQETVRVLRAENASQKEVIDDVLGIIHAGAGNRHLRRLIHESIGGEADTASVSQKSVLPDADYADSDTGHTQSDADTPAPTGQYMITNAHLPRTAARSRLLSPASRASRPILISHQGLTKSVSFLDEHSHTPGLLKDDASDSALTDPAGLVGAGQGDLATSPLQKPTRITKGALPLPQNSVHIFEKIRPRYPKPPQGSF